MSFENCFNLFSLSINVLPRHKKKSPSKLKKFTKQKTILSDYGPHLGTFYLGVTRKVLLLSKAHNHILIRVYNLVALS